MSASLVGSEMCIRDRRTRKPASKQVRMKACSRSRRLAPRHASDRAHTPVSYTHLTLPTICSV
eukprot:14314820-Alexandrium_andersonii.AAC.1